MSESASPQFGAINQGVPLDRARQMRVERSRSWRDETQTEGNHGERSATGGEGGNGAGIELLKFKVEKLEEIAKEIMSELKAVRGNLSEIKGSLATTANLTDLAEIKGRLNSLASASELGEVKGAVSKLPTMTTMILLVVAVIGMTGFTRWAYDQGVDRLQQPRSSITGAAPPTAAPQSTPQPVAPPNVNTQ